MTSNWVGVRLYSVPQVTVVRLDSRNWTLVKVDHPALVGKPQSPGCLGTPLRCFGRIRRGITENALLERTTGNILHGDVVGSVPRASPIVGRDYVGVVESGGAFSLTPKAFDELLVFNVLVPKHL